MTSDLPPDTAERLAMVLLSLYPEVYEDEDNSELRDAAVLLPTVAQLVADARADAVRSFSLAAARKAANLGRRGPYAIADWLLDLGHDRIVEIRQGGPS